MKIIINADDFGLSKGVCDGIIYSHLNGVVKSTTIMANAPAYQYGLDCIRKTPSLDVGIHLVLTYGKPLRNDVPSLVNENGIMKRVDSNNPLDVDLEEVYLEWCTQIETVSKDIKLTHFDSHHHIHLNPELKKIVERISKKYQLPYRGLKTTPNISVKLVENFYEEKVSLDTIESLILTEKDTIDIMTHPANVDDILQKNSSYVHWREKELELLCSKELKALLEQHNITICSYKSI